MKKIVFIVAYFIGIACNPAGFDANADRKKCEALIIAGAGARTVTNDEILALYILCTTSLGGTSNPPDSFDTRSEDDRDDF